MFLGKLGTRFKICKPFGALSQIVCEEGEFFKPGKRAASAELEELDDVLVVRGLKRIELFSGSNEGEGFRGAWRRRRIFNEHFRQDKSVCLKIAEPF